jgi:uncharacterized RDD family membrane protein YckC
LQVASEGALAPDLMRREPAGERAQVPAFKKREPSWKDEVRERMRHRKRSRSDGGELPLFPESDVEEVLEHPATASELEQPPFEAELEPPPAEAADASYPDASAAVEDFPMRPREEMPASAEPAPDPVPELPPHRQLVELGEEPPADEPQREESVERPAYLGERARAAAVDGLLIAGVSAVVVYFAARAARVSLPGLLPTWPYLASFIAFFGLVYAAFFTGLTGQTLGKMLFHLRVVDRKGAPPGHARAALRATLGTFGSLALVGIAPALLDPARRALHDRALRTRVIRI